MGNPCAPQPGRAAALAYALAREPGLLWRAWRLLGRYQRALGPDGQALATLADLSGGGADARADGGPGDADRAFRVFRMVYWMSLLRLPRPLCLPRALALLRLLEAEGMHPVLRIGVRRPAGPSPGFHAWVEVAGRPVGEPDVALARFEPLGPAPAGRR